MGIAERLQQAGLTGHPVLLDYQPGLEFIDAFLGCLVAGVCVVSVAALCAGRKAQQLDHFILIVLKSGARLALPTGDRLAACRHNTRQRAELELLRWLVSDDLHTEHEAVLSLSLP